jgi:hypothetical protein
MALPLEEKLEVKQRDYLVDARIMHLLKAKW